MTLVIIGFCLVVAVVVPPRGGLTRSATGADPAAAVSHHADPVLAFGRWLTRSRRHRLLIGALPEFVDLVARGLRGGANLHVALTEAAEGEGPASRSIREVLIRVAGGERLGEGFDRWAGGLDHPDANVVRAVLRLGESTGGALAVPLERAAATLRERAALSDEIRALTAQARVSSMVVALAPLGFLGVVTLVDRGSATVLFTSPLGLACLVAGLVLDAVGIVWMSRIAAAVEQ